MGHCLFSSFLLAINHLKWPLENLTQIYIPLDTHIHVHVLYVSFFLPKLSKTPAIVCMYNMEAYNMYMHMLMNIQWKHTHIDNLIHDDAAKQGNFEEHTITYMYMYVHSSIPLEREVLTEIQNSPSLGGFWIPRLAFLLSILHELRSKQLNYIVDKFWVKMSHRVTYMYMYVSIYFCLFVYVQCKCMNPAIICYTVHVHVHVPV